MSEPPEVTDEKMESLARALLEFSNDLGSLNACNTFILHAFATTVASGDGMDTRSLSGAIACAQWLSDQAVELERRLDKIRRQAYGAARQV